MITEKNHTFLTPQKFKINETVFVKNPNSPLHGARAIVKKYYESLDIYDVVLVVSGEVHRFPSSNLSSFKFTFSYEEPNPTKNLTMKNVIFSHPATIVFWSDGTKTVVKARNEPFDPEKGLAMAIAKKANGNTSSYYKRLQKWLPKKEEENE